MALENGHPRSRSAQRRLQFGQTPVDLVDLDGAIARVFELIDTGVGGIVVTPNVDHVMLAEEVPDLARIQQRAALSIADGMPLVWASKLYGNPLPGRVAGSDLVPLLLERGQIRKLPVYLLGGPPGAGDRAAEQIRKRWPDIRIVGIDAPWVQVPIAEADAEAMAERIRSSGAQVILAGFGCPKQEFVMDAIIDRVRPAVALGIGATIQFLAGDVARAPRWMAKSGLEWLHRLASDPKRLAHRYLVRDTQFLGVLARDYWNGRMRSGREET